MENSLKFVPKCPQPSFASDNGLAPNRWKVTIWTNTDLLHWRIYVALGGDELNETL